MVHHYLAWCAFSILQYESSALKLTLPLSFIVYPLRNDIRHEIVVRFKGPAAQKTFVLGHRSESYTDSESDPDKLKFAASESLRSIFALTNQNTAPPVTTDSENIWVFEKDKGDDDTIVARLRLASYLNAQSDSLYFDAKNRSVSFADYKLTFKRAA